MVDGKLLMLLNEEIRRERAEAGLHLNAKTGLRNSKASISMTYV